MLFLDVNKVWCVSSIECFHSRGQHVCKFIGTKESVCIRKQFNSQKIGLGHQHGRRFIVLEHQYGRRDVMWKQSIDLFSMYLLFSQWTSFDNTQTQRTLSFKFSSYSCAYEKTNGQIPLRPNLHWENRKTTWRASRVVGVGGGGVLPIMAYTRRLHPKGVPSSGFTVKSVRGSSPMKLSRVRTPPQGSWLCQSLTNSLLGPVVRRPISA